MPAQPTSSKAAWAILAAMGFGALIAQMFSTVIGPALGQVKADLDMSLSSSSWTITAYSLAFGAALVAGGRLGDLIGEVKIIVIGFAIFAVGLVMSALAADAALMIAGRGIQGIGIGLSAPATLSIVVNVFDAKRRGLAVGVWGFAHGAGLFIGPVLAGYMLEVTSWRALFWIALPLTAAVIGVTLAATRSYRSTLAGGTYDWKGLIVGAAAVTALTYGLQESSSGWGQVACWLPLIGGAAGLALFIAMQSRTLHPLVDLSLFRLREFAGAFIAESAVGFVYIPMLVFVGSVYLIDVLKYDPAQAGWIIAITTVVCMLVEAPAGWVVDRIGARIPVTVSLAMQAGALAWMGTFTAHTDLSQLVGPLALMGIGVGIALPACNTAGMSAVDTKRAGMGSGLMQMTFNLPAALGVALVTSIIGTMTAGRIVEAMAGGAYDAQASAYAQAVNAGDEAGASHILSQLPAGVADQLSQAAVDAQASTISMGMVALAVVAAAGAIAAAVLIRDKGSSTQPPVDAAEA